MITLRYYETNDRELLSFVNEEITAVNFLPLKSYDNYIIIYRGDGYIKNKSIADKINENKNNLKDFTIYTNDEELLLMLQLNCLNEETMKYSIYINNVWVYKLYENLKLTSDILKKYQNKLFEKYYEK